MVAQYYPQYATRTFNCAKGSTGDGIVLGLEAGGMVECMGRTLGAFLSAYQSKYELAFLHYTTPGLIVNINGDSIGNITKNNHPMLAAALENPDNGETFYYVFDEAARMRTKDCVAVGNGLTYGVSYEPLFETGEAVHYDSLEAAAEALNLPNLVQTIETNNEHSRKGEEDESGRTNLPLIDDRDGVYLLRVIPTYYLTTGGLAADTDGRILREDGSVIPGLYGAGDVLGALEEKDGKSQTALLCDLQCVQPRRFAIARNAPTIPKAEFGAAHCRRRNLKVLRPQPQLKLKYFFILVVRLR